MKTLIKRFKEYDNFKLKEQNFSFFKNSMKYL